MNTKEFVKVLRTVIREEVRSAVREELKSVLTESKVKKQPTQTKIQQPQKKSITGNPLLDQVLNETKLTSEFRQSADVGYDDFGSFTTNNIQATPSMMDMDIQEEYESPLPEMNPGMPFMKDYSQLMKKADQISQQRQF
jgi:hypothetical protein